MGSGYSGLYKNTYGSGITDGIDYNTANSQNVKLVTTMQKNAAMHCLNLVSQIQLYKTIKTANLFRNDTMMKAVSHILILTIPIMEILKHIHMFLMNMILYLIKMEECIEERRKHK